MSTPDEAATSPARCWVFGVPGGVGAGCAASLPGLLRREDGQVRLAPGEFALVVAESPPAALARAWDADPSLDALAFWDAWARNTRSLLHLVMHARERCIVVELDDIATRTQVVAERLQGLSSRPWAWPQPALPAAPDPLLLAVAEQAWRRASASRRVHEELLASCELLVAAVDPASRASGLGDDAEAALRSLQALRGEAATLKIVQRKLVTEREARNQANQELAGRQTRIEQLVAEREAAENATRALQARAAALEQQQRILDRERDQAAKAHQQRLSDALAEQEALAAKLAQAQQRVEAAAADAAASARARHEAEAAAAAAAEAYHADAEQVRFEAEVALVQLAAATETIESSQAELSKLRAAWRERDEAVVPGQIALQELRVVHARDDRPFRELSLAVRGVRFGDAPPRQGQVRLVEHHGQAGLAVFGGAELPPLLKGWRETGREGERRYMLLMPGDHASRSLLDALDTPDWLTLRAVAERAESVLREAPAAQRSAWLPLAQRVLQHLEGLAPVIRVAQARLRPATTEGSLGIELAHVLWAGVRVPLLQLALDLGPRRGLALVLPADGRPPLTTWPDIDGEPPAHLLIPLGAHRTKARQAPWVALPDADRRFVAALVHALPRLVEPALVDAGASADTVRQALLVLADEARERIEPWPVRELLPRLVRRAARRCFGLV